MSVISVISEPLRIWTGGASAAGVSERQGGPVRPKEARGGHHEAGGRLLQGPRGHEAGPPGPADPGLGHAGR